MKNIVNYYIRNDGWVLAYLPSSNPNIWDWDETYYINLEEFNEKYKDYIKVDITDEENEYPN